MDAMSGILTSNVDILIPRQLGNVTLWSMYARGMHNFWALLYNRSGHDGEKIARQQRDKQQYSEFQRLQQEQLGGQLHDNPLTKTRAVEEQGEAWKTDLDTIAIPYYVTTPQSVPTICVFISLVCPLFID